VEAGDESELDRVAPGHKDNRHRGGCGVGRERCRGIADDQGHRPPNQFGNERGQPMVIFRRAQFDRDILALDKACFLQTLAEYGHPGRDIIDRPGAQKPNHWHRWLLRVRRERPCRCTAQCEYEFSPPDVDCHANPPAGGRVHAIRRDDITL
jgi:hypothetical protein